MLQTRCIKQIQLLIPEMHCFLILFELCWLNKLTFQGNRKITITFFITDTNLQLDRKKSLHYLHCGFASKAYAAPSRKPNKILPPPKNVFRITLNLLKLLSLNAVVLMHNPMGQNKTLHNYVTMATSFVKIFRNWNNIHLSGTIKF